MKSSQVVTLVIAFVLGAALVFGINSMGKSDDGDLQVQLSESQAEVNRLKALLNSKKDSKLSAIPMELTTTDLQPKTIVEKEEEPEESEGGEEVADIATAISEFANSKQGRNIMKMMSSRFSQQGEAMIERGIAEYTEKLDLSDAQVASLKERLSGNMKEQMDAFNAKLDNESLSMQEIMQEQGEIMRGQEDMMAGILKEELTPEQFEQYEYEQVVEKTERVQRDSDRELSRLDRDLDLTQEQEDQVFGILVQTNSDYDESMGIEGVGNATPLAEGTEKDDAIRAVLTPEQAETYTENQERRSQRNPWGGGGGRGGFGGFGR